jgi:hypothetical protein
MHTDFGTVWNGAPNGIPYANGGASWHAGSGAIFDVTSNELRLRFTTHRTRRAYVPLKTMFVADNGSDWFISGAPDPRWNDDELATIRRVTGRSFEVVRMDGITQ